MIKSLLKQPKNIISEFGWLHLLQLAVVLAAVAGFLINRLNTFFFELVQNGSFNYWQSAGLTAGVYIIVSLSAAPFIFLYLLPRQKELLVFYQQPLQVKQLYGVLKYYYYKYHIITLAVFLIPGISLSVLNPFAGIVLLITLLVSSGAVFSCSLFIFFKYKTARKVFSVLFFILFVFGMLAAVLYIKNEAAYMLPALFVSTVTAAVIFPAGIFRMPYCDLALLYPLTDKIYNSGRKSGFSFSAIPNFLPARMQMLFNSYFLSTWRSPRYRRLKIMTVLIYLFVLYLITLYVSEAVDMILTIAGMALIYLHYSNYFNRKYVLPEPEWYFLTLPNRFWHIWISKFLSESLYIFLILICHWLFLAAWGADPWAQFNLLAILVFFGLFTVSTVLNFQILFYDDPRLGGYAYHFLIIFAAVLTYNYRFVGPLTALFLLGLNFYRSYKQYNA